MRGQRVGGSSSQEVRSLFLEGPARGRLGMDGGRVEDRNRDVLLLDQERQFGAAEDHALRPFTLQPLDDPQHLPARRLRDLPVDELVEDDRVDRVAVLGVRDERLDPLFREPLVIVGLPSDGAKVAPTSLL